MSSEPRHGSDKGEAILAAALELFVERGFHGTAVPLVAERAGVGAGTIYRYFASKEALVNAVYQKWKMEIAKAVLDNFPGSAPPREQFHLFWQRLARFAIQHRRAFEFLELHHHASYLDEQSRALEARIVAAAQAFIQSAISQQALKDHPPMVLMVLVWGAFVGLARACSEGRVTLDARTIEIGEQCAWEAIRR
jgi:AcrR family transcriptional regulator